MKNKLSDLNNHLFAQLERLSDDSAAPELRPTLLAIARVEQAVREAKA